MDLFTLLGPLDPDVTPDRCKLHLATWNGLHDPLDLYLEGVFDEWQSDQNRRNFSRCDFIVALIAMPEPGLWLFAGVHDVLGNGPWHKSPPSVRDTGAVGGSRRLARLRDTIARSHSERYRGRRSSPPSTRFPVPDQRRTVVPWHCVVQHRIKNAMAGG